jgi:hypothetical protein
VLELKVAPLRSTADAASAADPAASLMFSAQSMYLTADSGL